MAGEELANQQRRRKRGKKRRSSQGVAVEVEDQTIVQIDEDVDERTKRLKKEDGKPVAEKNDEGNFDDAGAAIADDSKDEDEDIADDEDEKTESPGKAIDPSASTLQDSDYEFDSLKLSESTRNAIRDIGYERMTEVQARCVPLALAGKDILGEIQQFYTR
jgi:ATP-dependent RNA helicase DDX18/HAS1